SLTVVRSPIEGMLASSAPYLAVMDTDLQHDSPQWRGRAGQCDVHSARAGLVRPKSRTLAAVPSGSHHRHKWPPTLYSLKRSVGTLDQRLYIIDFIEARNDDGQFDCRRFDR